MAEAADKAEEVGKTPEERAAAGEKAGSATAEKSPREQALEEAQKNAAEPRSKTKPVTSAGPLEPDETMTEQELWQRAEAEHMQHNKDELARAAEVGDLVVVQSNLDSDRVAFTEYDDAHPHGFAFVGGRDTPPQIVGNTPGVQQAILDRRIKLVKADIPK